MHGKAIKEPKKGRVSKAGGDERMLSSDSGTASRESSSGFGSSNPMMTRGVGTLLWCGIRWC